MLFHPAKNITIPSTVGVNPQTNYNPLEYINYALRDASSLETIEVESGNEKLFTDGIGLYNADKTSLYGVPRSANKNTYRIADNTTFIAFDAFYKSYVTDVFIPKSVTDFGRASLDSCKDIYYEGNQEEWDAV